MSVVEIIRCHFWKSQRRVVRLAALACGAKVCLLIERAVHDVQLSTLSQHPAQWMDQLRKVGEVLDGARNQHHVERGCCERRLEDIRCKEEHVTFPKHARGLGQFSTFAVDAPHLLAGQASKMV